MAKPTKQAAERRGAILRAAQARSAKALPEASAPITAHDVWRFKNSEDAQASNALVGGTIADTLESCAWVLAFLSEFHCRKPSSELSDSVEAGMVLVIDWVLDAVEKQSKQLEVDHG
jgi:hypothetical protein